MSNEDPAVPSGANQPSRSPRQGVGGSPVGSTLSIVLAVVAVIAGFLILNNITDDGGSGDSSGGSQVDATTTTAADGPATTTTVVAPTTTLVTEGATVIVANVSGVSGSAGRMTDTLELAGFTMGEPTNGTSGQQEDSVVYYDPSIAAAQDVANSVALVMGSLTVETVPAPPPVQGGALGDAGVLVMLGTNQADKTLEEMSGAAEVDETPSTGTSPAVSGGTTTTVEEGAETTIEAVTTDG